MYPLHFDLSPERALFQKTSREFLEREAPLASLRERFDEPGAFDRALWRQEAQLGWFALLVPETTEDADAVTLLDAALVAEEAGRLVQPGPIVPVNIVGDTLRRRGNAAQQALAERMADGATIATWCVGEPETLWGQRPAVLRADATADGFSLTGAVPYVQDAASAEHLLITAHGAGDLVQFLLAADTPGITVEPMPGLDLARGLDIVRFEQAAAPSSTVVGTPGGARADVERQLLLALALQNAESVGALNRVFEFTVEYAKDRVAFGRPLGSFQAIKHRLADLLTVVEACKATSAAALEAVEAGGEDAAVLVSTAKAYIAEHAPTAIQDCIQIHGGIGVTWDHDLHLYLRRVTANAALYGTASAHRERIVDLLAPPLSD